MQSPMCDVMWDKAFVGGATLDGLVPDRRGYRIPHYSLLNLGKYRKAKAEKSEGQGQRAPKVNGDMSQSPVQSNNRQIHSNRSPAIQIKQR